MRTGLRILYTQNLRGDLDRLPRIYTFLKTLKNEERTILLDLGDSCDADVWHCAATDGRSVLIGLDGMGFHAANVRGVLSAESRAKLAEQVSLSLIDDDTPQFVDESTGIMISLSSQAKTTFTDGVLHLQTLKTGQIGEAFLDDDPLALQSASVYDVPPTSPSDPTIAGVIDFILEEARFYQQRRNDR